MKKLCTITPAVGESWELSLEEEIGSLALIVFKNEITLFTCKARFDTGKEGFIDFIPIVVPTTTRKFIASIIRDEEESA